MADLIYIINSSLDGYIADENGDFNWTEPSEEVHAFFNDFQRSVGTVLYGRRMYETMRVWETYSLDDLPEVQREFAEAWRATEKIVYSSTLDAVTEPRTRLERTFDPKMVQTMKDDADRDLGIGGPVLAAEAMRAGLVDRYQLLVIPTIVGGGTPALPDGVRVDLALNASHQFGNGSVLLDYRLRRT
jgi:dihydrofolate reductase